MNSYYLCEKIVGPPIVYYVLTTFFQLIINIQTIVEYVSINGILIFALIWTVKNTFLVTLLSVECEEIHTSLKNVQVACIITMHSDSNLEFLREVRKKLRRIGRQKFQPLSALGLFTVNAALLLNMLSALSTYTVILLQFDFL
ncbi:unnamed protein product, partial [Iphiclides podalirius]